MPPSRASVLVALAATLGLAAALGVLGAPLTTEAARVGIVSFELAGTRATADAILASWGEEGRRTALLVQALDCPFPVAYGAFGALLARRLGAETAARACVVAALLDGLVENPLLDWQIWRGAGSAPAAAVAAVAAAAKFALLVGAAGVAVVRAVRR